VRFTNPPLRVLLLFLLATGSTGACARRSEDQAERGPTGRAVLRPPQDFPGSNARIGIRRPPPRDDGDPGMLPLIVRAVGDSGGRIAYLGKRQPGDRRFGPLEARIEPIAEQPFAGVATRPALQALQKAGARFLIVSALDPAIEPWPSEQSSTVRELLRDGVPPPGFDPIVIGRAHVLYRVAPTLEVSAAQMASITKVLRARLAGTSPAGEVEFPADDRARGPGGKVRLIVAVRGVGHGCTPGQAEGFVVGEATTVRSAVDAAAEQLRDDWGRMRKRLGCSREMPGSMSDAVASLTLQVELVHRMAAITDREPDRLYSLVELGREGVYLSRRGRTAMVSPARTIHSALDNERAMVERLGTWFDQGEDAWRDPNSELGRFETIAWNELRPGAPPIPLYRGVKLIEMRDVTRENLVEGLVLGARFLARNQAPSGEYRYLYRPLRAPRDRWTRTNNIVRHSLCPLVVLRAAQLRPDPELVGSAKRGIDYTLGFLRHIGDRCHVWYQAEDERQGNAKMGTVAAMVISILELGRMQDIQEYRDELECLGAQILAMQEESGEFVHYDVPSGHPFHGTHNTIYPGELMLALSRLYEWSGDARYRQAFDRAMGFEQRWFRETRARTEDDGVYNEQRRIDLISFEPWGIMAVDDMHRQTGDRRYADFGFELVEFMDGLFQYDLGRAQYADYLGGYFKTEEELPAINSCGYTEGAAAAFAIALRTGDRIEERRRALLLGLRFVLQLQYHPERSLFYLPDQDAANGGFRYNLSFSRVRNDYMYHAMNALALGAVTLRPEDYRARFSNVPDVVQPAFVPDAE